MHSGATTHHRCRFGVELTQVWSWVFGRVSTLSVSPGCLQNASPLLPLPAHKPLWYGVMKLCCIICIFYLVTCSSPHTWEAQIDSAHSWTGPSVSQLCQRFWSQTPDGVSLIPSLPSLQVLSLPPGRCSSHPAALLFFFFPQVGYCQLLSPLSWTGGESFSANAPQSPLLCVLCGSRNIHKAQWLWSRSPAHRCIGFPCTRSASCLLSVLLTPCLPPFPCPAGLPLNQENSSLT